MTGGFVVGGASDIDTGTYLHDMLGQLAIGGNAQVQAISQETMAAGFSFAGSSALLFDSPNTLVKDMFAGVSFGGAAALEFDGTVIFGFGFGGGAAIVFSSLNVHDLGDDGQPNGGLVVGGAAIVQEVLPVIPTQGVTVGGAAACQFVSIAVPTGGVVLAGDAPSSIRYAFAPSGGVVVAGEALVKDRQALHVPTGGIVVGGEAFAYAIPSSYPATTANPYARPYPGWAMDLESGAPTRYSRLPANSLCHFNGVDYVANEGGIYALGGANDDGRAIAAAIQLAQTDYGSENNKQVEAMYLGVRSSGKLRLSVSTNNGKKAYYAVTPDPDVMSAVRVKIGRGLAGRYWTWRLDNENGSDFELESLSHTPVVLARHGR